MTEYYKRIKCPDCNWSEFQDEAVGMTPCYSCNSTGYKYGPVELDSIKEARYKQAIKDSREGKELDLTEEEFEIFCSIENMYIDKISKVKEAECQQRVERIRTSLEFASKVATVMDELRSSHVFFILQQAYGDMEWGEAQDIINTVIEQTGQSLKEQEMK